MNQKLEDVKQFLDWSAFATGVAVFFDILPKVVGVFTLIWLGMQMWTWLVNKKWKLDK